MAIAFHCEHCGKKIEAPDNAGGKWGKCPACHKKVYIPGLDEDEELKLAPVDEGDLARQNKLIAETRMLEQEILSEKEVPDDSTEVVSPTAEVNDKELTKNIIFYLQQMANGNLDQADRIANSIAPSRRKALKILDGIALSEIPEPELADIPQQVLSGFIRTLRAKIS
jgi:hypothetical protein